MHLRGILALGLVLGALYAALRFAERQEDFDRPAVVAPVPLLEGLEESEFLQLTRVRIEHVLNQTEVLLERDGEGRWFLTDPVAWPAEPSVLKLLFDTAVRALGEDLGVVDEAAVGLAPPRSFCTFTVRGRDGAADRSWTLAVGSADLDRTKAIVRVESPDGTLRTLRTTRTFEALFDRFEDDYRDHAILGADPADLVELRRSLPSKVGTATNLGPVLPGLPNPLAARAGASRLHLAQGDDGWRVLEPEEGRADPQAVTLLLAPLARLRARRFVAESLPIPGLFGFDDPELELEVGLASGQRVGLQFARRPDERERQRAGEVPPEASEWLCRRTDLPVVFEVEARDVLLFSSPAEALFDYRILRGELGEAERCEVAAGGRALTFSRDAQGWWVEASSGSPATAQRWPAEAAAVEELLLAFRQSELGDLAPGVEPPATLVPTRLDVHLRGVDQGGVFAPDPRGASPPEEGGGEVFDASRPGLRSGWLYRRQGDRVWMVVDASLVESLQRPREDYFRRRLVEVEEIELAAITLARGDRSLTFRRDPDRGSWSLPDGAPAPTAFTLLVDRLRAPRAVAFEAGRAEALVDPLEVTLELARYPGIPRATEDGIELPDRLAWRLGVGDSRGDPCDLLWGWWAEDRCRLFPGLRADLGALLGE